MIINMGKEKRTLESAEETTKDEPLKKKVKKHVKFENNLKNDKTANNKKYVNKINKKELNNKFAKNGKNKPFIKNFQNPNETKPPNWIEFKQKKKEVQLKRKESRNSYDIVVQAKKLGEILRRKTLKGGEEERIKVSNDLHKLLTGNYVKLVMTHDIARIIQQLVKFGTDNIRNDIAKELKTVIVDMIQSKYAKYCVNRLLKDGDAKTRSEIIEACYGNVVKLTSHVISAEIINNAYSTYANVQQKQHFIQEFFGDMYKQSKDDSIKHLKDVYEKSPDMKSAILGATKANLQRILNKQLLDSHLVQNVLMQYLQECSKEDRLELIPHLASHCVILSNSKEGVRAVMTCFWNGTNKDRKVIMKALKDHVIELSKHEHGYCTIIGVIDSADDTLLTNKILITEIVKKVTELIGNEWGRKVLLWLVAPGNSTYFHPVFINEMKQGRENSECKKDPQIRYKEILNYSLNLLLKHIAEEPEKWLACSSSAVITSAVLKAGIGEELKKALEALAKIVTDLNWKVKENNKEIKGIESAGIHMNLKKIILYDKSADENRPKFGEIIIEQLNEEIIQSWIQCNRGCFLILTIIESNSIEVGEKIRKLLKHCKKDLKHCSSAGSKILLEKYEKIKCNTE